MAKAKKRKKASKKGGSRRRGILLLFGLLAVMAALALSAILFKAAPEVPIAAQLSGKFGKGSGDGPGQLNSPRGIAVDGQGRLYVTDLGNSRISVFNPDGTPAFSFGKKGEEPPKSKAGEFNEPSGVAVAPDGTVYVADAWNGRIQAFDPKGKPKAEFGGARFSFYSPRNVAVDQQGNFYVADTGNSMVKVYNPGGKELKVLGGKGKGGGHFNEVFGIAINAKGEVFVADPGNQRIHKFSALPAGDFIKDRKVPGWQLGAPFWPQLACDLQGNVYAVDSHNRKVWVYDSELNYKGTIGGPGNDLFASPLGLAFGPKGELFVGEVAGNQVLRLTGFSVPMGK
jgi:DNA-binding beta-propeller fold protein YncE